MHANKALAPVLTLPIFGIAAALLVGEVFARLTWTQSRPPKRVVAEQHSDLPKIEKSLRAITKPQTRGIYNGAYFRTNAFGFRGPDIIRILRPGVFRIAVIGDSVAMGSGVANDEVYISVATAWLNEIYASPRFEYLNLALSGLDIPHIANRAIRHAGRFQPHLLVYGVTLNDIQGPNYVRSAKRNLEATRDRYHRYASSPSYFLRLVWPGLQSFRDRFFPGSDSYMAEVLYNFLENDAAWNDFVTELRRLNDFSRRAGIKLVLFQHTPLTYLNLFHPFFPVYDKIRNAAATMGIPTISSFDDHAGRDELSLWVSNFDPHPNNEGHHILASALVRGLLELPDTHFPRRSFTPHPR